MKKIGIVTLFGNFNYGNRLQNFAMQKILTSLGSDVKTLVCEKKSLKSSIKPIYNIIFSPIKPECKRYVSFKRFNKKYLKTETVKTNDGLFPNSLSEKYDAFVVGSDQVWNPSLRVRERHNFFLRFAKDSQKIAVAPSIGVPEIEEKYKEEYKEYLEGFKYLSCREENGAKSLSALTGKECTHIIDPTLVLSREEWLTSFGKEGKEEKYVLLLFLGKLEKENRERINSYAREHSLKIIEISNKEDKHYASSPDEFVRLISGANIIFTDSFHAAAFSVNFNIPFYVLNRNQNDGVSNKMTSRISSLVSLFSLEERYVENSLGKINPACDFTKANARLKEEREKFLSYVSKCIFALQ